MINKKQANDLSQQVRSVLTVEKLKALSPMQLQMMDRLMDQSLEEVKNDTKQITSKMIVGMYEMVTKHLQPIDFQ
jgi:hypothetical protein